MNVPSLIPGVDPLFPEVGPLFDDAGGYGQGGDVGTAFALVAGTYGLARGGIAIWNSLRHARTTAATTATAGGQPATRGAAPNTAASLADDVPAFARSQYGRVPAAERAAVLERAPTCPYCGTNPLSQVDHISALRRDWVAGGWVDDFATRTARVNDPGNLIGACASCNAAKDARAIGEGAGQWWPPGWPSGSWWPFGGGL